MIRRAVNNNEPRAELCVQANAEERLRLQEEAMEDRSSRDSLDSQTPLLRLPWEPEVTDPEHSTPDPPTYSPRTPTPPGTTPRHAHLQTGYTGAQALTNLSSPASAGNSSSFPEMDAQHHLQGEAELPYSRQTAPEAGSWEGFSHNSA